MNTRLLMVVAVIILAGITSGCVSDNNNISSNASVEDNVTVIHDEEKQVENTDNSNVAIETMENVVYQFSEDYSQSTAYAISGDTVIIILEENPTTGYSWNMTYSEGLELKEDAYLEASINADLVGAAGSHIWTFEVTERGEQNISAIYRRPWEEITGTEDHYELTIKVISESELINDSGTVTYNNLEGGFYGIVGTDDAKYDPINLPDDFRTDATRIRFTAYTRDDMTGFHMWGQIIELRTISPIL
ncbi:protease inhibitor I42 family protein [uncultured Methanolobus sp.]|uniref:protease inhibitor I42 family protein n=1 Tax=uncultured Methanolobus sp. TaxID=218300 RepID=UPI002AAB7D90|nr:protease inhibitor I42 family protein [uncultured Methanolobus sp.]